MERKWLKVKMILQRRTIEQSAGEAEETHIKNCTSPPTCRFLRLACFVSFAIFLVNWVKEMANNNWYEMRMVESMERVKRARTRDREVGGGGTRASWWVRILQNEQRKQIMRSKIDECNLWRSATEQNITKESRMIYVFLRKVFFVVLAKMPLILLSNRESRCVLLVWFLDFCSQKEIRNGREYWGKKIGRTNERTNNNKDRQHENGQYKDETSRKVK